MNRNDALVVWNNPLETWKQCGGYYKCPIDEKGQRIGPLVGYTGKYRTNNGNWNAYVGEEYWNFAKVEQYPRVLDYFSLRLCCKILNRMFSASKTVDVILAAPLGGILFASSLARVLQCRSIFGEKRTMIASADQHSNESQITLDRHEIYEGEDVLILEDVINNFSTTEKLITLVESRGGKVREIACALNRSSKTSYGQKCIPVVSVIDAPTAQYTQDDPYVLSDIVSGNVVWKPKDAWKMLMNSMEQQGGRQ